VVLADTGMNDGLSSQGTYGRPGRIAYCFSGGVIRVGPQNLMNLSLSSGAVCNSRQKDFFR